MKRSGQVGLVVMGAVAFAGTYAAVAGYRASASSSQPQSAMAQSCTTRPDGTQACEPQRRGFSYYFIPHFAHGWWFGGGTAQSAAVAGNAMKTQSVALTNTARPTTPGATGVQRGGFGTSASGSFRVSAGG
jgi:hypothetical protein